MQVQESPSWKTEKRLPEMGMGQNTGDENRSAGVHFPGIHHSQMARTSNRPSLAGEPRSYSGAWTTARKLPPDSTRKTGSKT